MVRRDRALTLLLTLPLLLCACEEEDEGPKPLVLPFLPSNLADVRYDEPGDLLIRDNATLDASAETPAVSGADTAYNLTRVITQTDGTSQAVLFVAHDVDIVANSTLTVVTGSLPVIFLATGNVTIDGSLVVAANAALPQDGLASGFDGPSEETTAGSGPGGGGAADEATHVGAGGGGHCGAGGAGGPDASNGGATYGSATLIPLEGGSSGGSGRGGPGGAGGGAVQIAAGGWITVSGTGLIHAGGGGGGVGGGGGGAGGSILLEAEVVAINGTVAANGGGGGANDPGDDQAGRNATPDSTPAPGGNIPAPEGPRNSGGAGAAGPDVDGAPGSYLGPAGGAMLDIGGGGGGGAGRIRIRTASGQHAGGGRFSPDTDTACTTFEEIDSPFFR